MFSYLTWKLICSRHTLEEVLGWFESAQLEVVHSYVDFYGNTVRGVNIGCK